MNKFFLTIVLIFFVKSAFGMTQIRDAEIELSINKMAKPIFEAAGLDPDSIEIIIIQSEEINAFVMGGQNIFITSELLLYSDEPETILGVIAHEVGHIKGGHLITSKEENENLRKKMILKMVLGAAAGAAVGSTDAAIGAGLGASSSYVGEFLKFSRTQENAADQAGIKIMMKLGISLDGLINFLKYLGNNERTFFNQEHSYLRTHPISSDRIEAIKSYATYNQNLSQIPYPDQNTRSKFQRAIAKLYAFSKSPNQTFHRYKGDDFNSIYAMAIANLKSANYLKSLKYINEIINEEPNNAFVHELKGQVFFESGDLGKAIESYRKSFELLPNEDLIKFEYSKALVASKSEVNKAIILLESILERNRHDINVWQQLSLSYGINKDKVNSNIAQGWAQALLGEYQTAKRFLKLAQMEANQDKVISKKLLDLDTMIKNLERE